MRTGKLEVGFSLGDRPSAVGLILGLCAIGCSGPEMATAPTVAKTEEALIGAGTPPNFSIYDPFFENVAKVRPPSTACPNGSIAMILGQPRGIDGLVQRPLYDSGGAIDTSTPSIRHPFPIPTTSATHTDPHLVRLADGSFLALKEGTTTAPLDPEPEWFDELIAGGLGIVEGSRGGVHLFHSVCGDAWTLRSIIDWGVVAGGVYGVPRPLDANGFITFDCSQQDRDDNGRLRWSFAASDRTEFYQCPFTGNLYVTTIVGAGPFCDENGNRTSDPVDASVLLVSMDGGFTFDLVAQLRRSAPNVMTSTPDGRLFVFGVLENPTVQFTQPMVPGDFPVLGPENVVLYNDGSGDVPHNVVIDADLFINPVTHLSVSRISTDTTTSKIRAAYPSVNASDMEETRVISIEVPSGGGAPIVEPIVTVQPEDPDDHSTLYFSFIEPDYLDMPSGVKSNVAMGYWIEPPRCREDEHRCAAQCFNIMTDNMHCGACNSPCASGEVCSQGTCVAACPVTETSCNQCDLYNGCRPNCVDTNTNVRHCGGCGITCNFGQVCSGGVCVTGSGKRGYSMRHMFFEGDCRATTPKHLSVFADHAPRYFETRPNASGSGGIGDYVYGGFWWHGGPNYFAHWSEIDRMWGATTRSPFSISAPPTTTCDDVVALCQDVALVAGASCSAVVTADRVDNGSFGPQGGAVSLALNNSGPFPPGSHSVTLTATSGTESSQCVATVTVTDQTPPVVTAPPNVTATQCLGSAPVTVGRATATDNCSVMTITGRVISTNGVTLGVPITVVGTQATLGIGSHVIEWTASDGVNQSAPVFQTVTVGPRIEARQSFLLADRARVTNQGGVLAAISNAGSGLTRVGNDAGSGGIFSVGPVSVLDRALIGGNILSASSVSVSPVATVNGSVTQFGSVVLPPLPALPTFPPPSGGDITVNSGTQSRGPGSYNVATLNGGTLVLTTPGDYYFRTLTINSGSTIRVANNARIFVQNQLAYRAPFRPLAGSAVQAVFLGFAGTSLTMEALFNGNLVAPNANVAFGVGSGLTFNGSFFASTIEVRPGSRLVCL